MKKTMTKENAVSAIQQGSLNSLEMTTELATNALKTTKDINRTILKKLLNGTKHILKKIRIKCIIAQFAITQ